MSGEAGRIEREREEERGSEQSKLVDYQGVLGRCQCCFYFHVKQKEVYVFC